MVSVDSGWVVLSTDGNTVMWSTGFSGCVGLVLCGPGPKGGMLAHINQTIQQGGMEYNVALQRVSEFYEEKRKQRATDVLIYFGDPSMRLPSQTPVDTIKQLMKCETVTDLRKQDKEELYGNEFIYDPSPLSQTVYTITPGLVKFGIVGAMLSEDPDEDGIHLGKKSNAWPYQSGEQLKLKGLGGNGWCIVD
jgi:hypothetical protein